MPKVSVIVPVYNVEKYLAKCLESLVNQTLKDIEIIVVNDGSPDHSQDIIDKYVKKHPQKIKAFKKKNGGLSDARNYGLKYASGDYISFIDSDDWVEPNMLLEMYNKAIKNDFDMVVCDVKSIEENGSFMIIDSKIRQDIYTQAEVKKQMIDIYPVAWNKLFKKELFSISKIKFKKNVWFEDVEFLYRLLPYVNSIGVIHKPFNNYLQRSGAISKTYDERLHHYIDNWNGIIDYYKQKSLFDEYKDELEYCYVRYVIGVLLKQAMNYHDKSFFKKTLSLTFKNVKQQFPHYRRNKYFYKSGTGIALVLANKFLIYGLYLIKRV